MARSSTSNNHEDARRDLNELVDQFSGQDPVLDYIVETCSGIIGFVKTVRSPVSKRLLQIRLTRIWTWTPIA